MKNTGHFSSYYSNLQYVTGLKIIDTYTIQIFLSQPQDFFEYNLTMPILCQAYFEGEDFVNTQKNANIIGTGMFQISEVSEGGIKLIPNSNYWNKNKKALLTQIDINLYSNIGEMYAAFKAGYIDIMDVTVNDIQSYIGSLGYTKIEVPQRDVTFLSFNTQHELFLDSRTRKAIALYLDKNNILANLGSGYMISNFLIFSNSWIYDTRLDISTSFEEADNLLTQAGWSYQNNKWVNSLGKVLEFSITVDNSKPDRVVAAQVIANQLANHGISVTVKDENNNTFSNDFNNKNYETMILRNANWF